MYIQFLMLNRNPMNSLMIAINCFFFIWNLDKNVWICIRLIGIINYYYSLVLRNMNTVLLFREEYIFIYMCICI